MGYSISIYIYNSNVLLVIPISSRHCIRFTNRPSKSGLISPPSFRKEDFQGLTVNGASKLLLASFMGCTQSVGFIPPICVKELWISVAMPEHYC